MLLSLGVAFIGGAWAWRRSGARMGLLIFGCGILMFGSWQAHKYLTRYDARSGYFGLQSVQVLALEAVGFVVIGAMLGVIWSKLSSR